MLRNVKNRPFVDPLIPSIPVEHLDQTSECRSEISLTPTDSEMTVPL